MDIWEAVSYIFLFSFFLFPFFFFLFSILADTHHRTPSPLLLLLMLAPPMALALATPLAVPASPATTVTAIRMDAISTPTDSVHPTFSDLARLLTLSLRLLL